MKKVKLTIIGIIVLLALVFIFQNQTYFLQKQILTLDLFVTTPFTTPEVSNIVICLASLLLGIILSFISSLSGRVKRKRAVKELNKTLTQRETELNELKNKVETGLAPGPGPESETGTTSEPAAATVLPADETAAATQSAA